jgi:hypothetical protein
MLWLVAQKNKDILLESISQQEIKQTTRNENIGLTCNIIIMVIAFLNPWLALILSFVMWAYWMGFNH